MEIMWILGALFIIVSFLFVAVAFLFPEAVGITGKIAKQIEEQHRGDQKPPTDSKS